MIVKVSDTKLFLAAAVCSPASAKDFFGEKLSCVAFYDVFPLTYDDNFQELEKVSVFESTSMSSISLLKSVRLTRNNSNTEDTLVLSFENASTVRSFVFLEDRCRFDEVFVSEFMPEFDEKLTGNVLHADIRYSATGDRWSLWGSDNGEVKIAKQVPSGSNHAVQKAVLSYDSPISVLSFLQLSKKDALIAVGGCLGPARVLRVDFDNGYADSPVLGELPNSAEYDCIISACVHRSRQNENQWVVLLSTFNKKLLVYTVTTQHSSNSNDAETTDSTKVDTNLTCNLLKSISFSHPVLSSTVLSSETHGTDITDVDRMQLGILTWKGLHLRNV